MHSAATNAQAAALAAKGILALAPPPPAPARRGQKTRSRRRSLPHDPSHGASAAWTAAAELPSTLVAEQPSHHMIRGRAASSCKHQRLRFHQVWNTFFVMF